MTVRRTPVLTACAIVALVLAAAEVAVHHSAHRSRTTELALRAAATGNLTGLKRIVAQDPALLRTEGGHVSLLGAALEGHRAAAVRMLLQGGASGSGTYHGRSLLSLAVDWGNCEIIRQLLAHGSDVNARGGDGFEPLHEAVGRGRADICRILLQHGADPNAADIELDTPLHVAVFHQNWRLAEELVRKGSDMTRLDGFGFCPLDGCLGRGDLHAVQFFLRCLGDMNFISRRSRDTPLLTLVMYRRISFFKPVVQMGANVNAPGGDGETPLGRASRMRFRAVAKALWSLGGRSRRGPLFDAVDADNLGRVASLLSAEPASVNRADRWGDRPIHEAILWGDPRMVLLLLARGADVNARDHINDTPLHEAAHIGDTALTGILLTHGADLRARSSSGSRMMIGETPLFRAAAGGHRDVVQQLISAGADVNARDDQGRTALYPAIRVRSLPLVQLLIDHGASVQIADMFGNTPLHYAAFLSQPAEVALFLKHGAAINAQNQLKQTPLHRALLFGDMATVRLLVDSGADLESRDMRGNTPAQDAVVRHHDRVADYLRACEQTASRRTTGAAAT